MKKIETPIQLFKVHMNPNAKNEVGKILDSGYIGQGSKVEEFEKKLNEYFNLDRVLTLNSGTSALHLAFIYLKNHQKQYMPMDIQHLKMIGQVLIPMMKYYVLH